MKPQKKWIVNPPITNIDAQQFPEINQVVLQLLFARDINTSEKIKEFLTPDYNKDLHDPFLFLDMDKVVNRVFEAIGEKEKITIHGDYDADGVCSSALLYETIKELGGDVNVYLPHREKEGYGINDKTIKFLAGEGTDLIITTDCGITNVQEIELAKKIGLDVIVTDHHRPQDELPDCLIIHPGLEREVYPFKVLAGGGVAFKLAQGLIYKKVNDYGGQKIEWINFEKWLLDLVAISTVADMVPLTGENRTLVHYGLVVLNKVKRMGLWYLLKEAGLLKENTKNLNLDTHHIGFKIGPRINAAGRMDHSNVAYELLVCKEREQSLILAKKLNRTNQERQELTQKIFDEAIEKVKQIGDKEIKILFAYDKDWPLGLVGLVAGKLVDKYNRPAVVLAELNGQIAGSVRSIPAFNFFEALTVTKDYFAKFGGHPMACGFTLNNNDDYPKLQEKLNDIIAEKITLEDIKPVLHIDMEVNIDEISWDLVENLQKMEPFGQKNPKPRFLSRNVILCTCNTIGNDNNHLRFTVSNGKKGYRKAIAWRLGNFCKELEIGQPIDIVYEIELNTWQGNTEIQLNVKDIRQDKKNKS